MKWRYQSLTRKGDDPRKATLKERRNRERRRREGQTRRREEAERLISDESGDDDRPTGKVEKGEDLLPLLGVTGMSSAGSYSADCSAIA